MIICCTGIYTASGSNLDTYSNSHQSKNGSPKNTTQSYVANSSSKHQFFRKVKIILCVAIAGVVFFLFCLIVNRKITSYKKEQEETRRKAEEEPIRKELQEREAEQEKLRKQREPTLKDLKEKNQNSLTPQLVGLPNISNSCFLNTAIQPLLWTLPYVMNGGMNTIIAWGENQTGVTQAFGQLAKIAYQESKQENPDSSKTRDAVVKLKLELGKISSDLSSGRQEDSMLALTTMLEAIDEALEIEKHTTQKSISISGKQEVLSIKQIKYQAKIIERNVKNKQSSIASLFNSTHIEYIQCLTCYNFQYLTVKRERELKLYSSNPNNNQPITKLEEGIQGYQQAYFLKKSSFHFFCDRCKKASEMLSKQQKIMIPPNLLILDVDRFNTNNDNSSKYTHKISYPLDDLHVAGESYELIAVLLHLGDTSSFGHYISFVKNMGTDRWWKLDDSKASRVSQNVVKDLSTYNSDYGSSTPTGFIYKRKGFTNLDNLGKKTRKVRLSLIDSSLRRLDFSKSGKEWVEDEEDMGKLWSKVHKKITQALYGLVIQKLSDLKNRIQYSQEEFNHAFSQINKKFKEKEYRDQKDHPILFPILAQLLTEINQFRLYLNDPHKDKLLSSSENQNKNPRSLKDNQEWVARYKKLVNHIIENLESINNKKKDDNKEDQLIEAQDNFVPLNGAFQNKLLALKKLIIREAVREDLNQDRLANALNNQNIILAIYRAIYSGIKEKKYLEEHDDQEKLYAYLDLIDHGLRTIGYGTIDLGQE